MARQPRFFAEGETLHAIQRGNNRVPVFTTERDYRFFLDCLLCASQRHGVQIHAYVLMTNHVHLLATPACKDSLPKVLQSLGRRYVQYFNNVHDRTGTLWEGRYRATVVDSEPYLLTCMRYIELNPVRAGIVDHPGRYRWSSFRANAGGATDALVTPHHVYERLAIDTAGRQSVYRRLFNSEIPGTDLEAIREATNKNWALGSEPFKRRIERLCGRRATPEQKGKRIERCQVKLESDPQGRV